MTTTDYRTGEVNDQAARSERARRAVAAFRRMQPMLNNYARSFTGNPRISVEISATSNGATDGKKIFYRPPIALGDDHKHNKKLCDKRDDETLLQLCPACEIREQILVVIYHEIAHISYGTFTQPSEQAQADLLRRAIEASGTKYADVIAKRIQMFGRHVKGSYLAMAGQISPFLPIILNAVEDARVNNNLFGARKGTRIMFEADTIRTFATGVETLDPDGTPRYLAWNEREQNLQLIVGLYCAISEYDYSDWFIPPVVAVLDDERVQELIVEARTTVSVEENYGLSFKFLERFRQLGFCKADTDPEDADEEPEPPATEPEESDEPDDQDTGGDDDEQGESEVETGDEQADEPDESGQPADAGEPDPDAESEDGSDEQPGSASGESEEDDSDTDQFGESDEGSVEQDTDTLEGDTGGEQAEEGGAESSDTPEAEADDAGEDADGESDSLAGDSDESDGDDSGADDEGMGDGADAPDPAESDSGEQSTEEESGDDAAPDAGADDGDDDRDSPTAPEPEGHHGDGAPDGTPGDDDSVDSDEFGDGEANQFTEDDDAEDEYRPDEDADESIEAQDDDADEDGERESGDEDDEPIDTGADLGMGGIEVEEADEEPEYNQPMGEADTVREGLQQFGHHEDKEPTEDDQFDDEALQTAIMQGVYFETPSQTIAGVRIHEYGKPVYNSDGENMSTAWGGRLYAGGYTRRDLGVDGDFRPEESIIGRALLKLRVVFADNQRAHNQAHLKSGRVNTRVLGRRAPLADERLFRRKIIPGKKSYFVAIALDISGSTVGRNLALIKAAAWAQAELLTRLGIPFAMYGCSGYYDSSSDYRRMFLDMYPIKHENEPWNARTQERLQEIGPDGGNLDGHNLEFMRKLCDESRATDCVIMYYSDGKMPATNHDEELEILQRELKTCKQRGYTVAGVGVRTDSPSRHGLPTVQIDDKNEIGKVVTHLEKMLRTKL